MGTDIYRITYRSGQRRTYHLCNEGGTQTFCKRDCNSNYSEPREVSDSEYNRCEWSWCNVCATIYITGDYPNTEMRSKVSEEGIESIL